ncbi:DUF6463 family protein [Marinicellulosiphila megalodicopiae]|uniref:DUF6463 family protein n=1 Tax=Marinicellulosiphila megalodicopiae TaxID=2724896 RepID=UPI003BAEFCE8
MKQKHFARFLLFITLGHLTVGVLLFGKQLLQIPKQGWVNVVGPNNLDVSVAVWFMLFAWPLLLIVIQFWNRDALVTKPFLLGCLTGSILGISLMPASGFWLLLVLAGVAIAKRNKNEVSNF